MAAALKASTSRPSRGQPLRWLLIALATVLLATLFGLQWLLRPATVTRLVLDRAGAALGLEISAAGIGEYRLRGQPQLVVRGLVARRPGDTAPLLSADRVLLSLPWSTLQTRGKDLTITRVELDGPRLDLQALTRWQETRPPATETRIPTLTDGLRINDGRMQHASWAITGLHAELPRLAPGEAVSATLAGAFEDRSGQVPFDLSVAMTAPSDGAGVAAIGPLAVTRDGWRIDGNLHLRGRLDLDDAGIALIAATLGYAGRWRAGDGGNNGVHFVVGAHGPFAFRDGVWRYGWRRLLLRGDGNVPALDGCGAFALGERLVLHLQGDMREWPTAWPALPSPLAQSNSPLPFALDYAGRTDLSDRTVLQLRRDATTFDAQLRLPAVLDWIGASTEASPLPPLDGRLSSPLLEVGGMRLRGVEVELTEDLR